MAFDDFCKFFKHVSICTLDSSRGYFKMLKNVWIGNESAGGSRNNLKSFATNPQYLFYIAQQLDNHRKMDSRSSISQGSIKINVDDGDDSEESLIVALMQDYRKSERNAYKVKLCQIGFIIYELNPADYGSDPKRVKRLPEDFFQATREFEKTNKFVNYREVIKRIRVRKENYYVIIPCTFNANEVSKFVLRLFCNLKFKLK